MLVRSALRSDLLDLRRVADAAHWETYSGLLKPDTIGRLLNRDYSPSSLGRRLLRGGVLVGESAGHIVGFVDVSAEPGQTRVLAIATEPGFRRRGVATALIASVRRPRLPMSADVLLGNIEGERFYEARGFVPGEIIHTLLFDQDVVERRWWLPPEG